MDVRAIWPVLELRQDGAELTGSFPYDREAVIADRGRRRKEKVAPRAFRFAVEDPEREINLLRGHSFDQPLASKRAGTLELIDSDDALSFRATLPPEAERPTWVQDTVLAVRGGLVRGVSPGFRVPPPDVVPGAETLIPEPGNPGVQIRVIRAAVLFELSLVTRPAYPETEVDARSEAFGVHRPAMPRVWL